MIKTLAAQIKEYKAASILTPLCMIGEVIMETLIPLMMASIIDYGVEKGDIRYEGIYQMINHLFAQHIPEQYIYIKLPK